MDEVFKANRQKAHGNAIFARCRTGGEPANSCLEDIDGSHTWGLLGDVRALAESHVAETLGAAAARNW